MVALFLVARMKGGGDGGNDDDIKNVWSSYLYLQGADNKLGQFLSQDIYATANHRNCLRHSLESCPSLV